jgi:hypothetical protein
VVRREPIPENSLPPAPWPSVDEMPGELAWERECGYVLGTPAALPMIGPVQVAVALAGLALLARAVGLSRA